jgi:hypothetical protein
MPRHFWLIPRSTIVANFTSIESHFEVSRAS